MRHQTTRSHRAARRLMPGSPGSDPAGTPYSGSHAAPAMHRPARHSSSAMINHILGGALIMLAGLGWAVGLALTSTSPGAIDRQLILKLMPWLVVLVGLALTTYGFVRITMRRG